MERIYWIIGGIFILPMLVLGVISEIYNFSLAKSMMYSCLIIPISAILSFAVLAFLPEKIIFNQDKTQLTCWGEETDNKMDEEKKQEAIGTSICSLMGEPND